VHSLALQAAGPTQTAGTAHAVRQSNSAAAEPLSLATGLAWVLRAAAFRHLRTPPSELPGAVVCAAHRRV